MAARPFSSRSASAPPTTPARRGSTKASSWRTKRCTARSTRANRRRPASGRCGYQPQWLRSTSEGACPPRPLDPLQADKNHAYRRTHPAPGEHPLITFAPAVHAECVVRRERDHVHHGDAYEKLQEATTRGGHLRHVNYLRGVA